MYAGSSARFPWAKKHEQRRRPSHACPTIPLATCRLCPGEGPVSSGHGRRAGAGLPSTSRGQGLSPEKEEERLRELSAPLDAPSPWASLQATLFCRNNLRVSVPGGFDPLYIHSVFLWIIHRETRFLCFISPGSVFPTRFRVEVVVQGPGCELGWPLRPQGQRRCPVPKNLRPVPLPSVPPLLGGRQPSLRPSEGPAARPPASLLRRVLCWILLPFIPASDPFVSPSNYSHRVEEMSTRNEDRGH